MDFRQTLEKVTIIIPVFDIERNAKNLNSFISDSAIVDCEKIIIHDLADKQDSSEFQKAVESVCNIKVIDVWCDSPGYARNVGLELATKDWIVFWDADDLPILAEFAMFMQELDMSKHGVGVASYKITDFQGKELSSKILNSKIQFRKNYELMINPGLWSWAFKKSLINKVRFNNNKLGEDQIFLVELEIFDKTIFKSSRSTYIHRLGSDKQLTFSPKYSLELLATARYALELCKIVESETRKFCKVLASVSLLVFLKRDILLRKHVRGFLIRKSMGDLFTNLFTSAPILGRVYFDLKRIERASRGKRLSIYLAGGLGNQLFQLSFALSRTNIEKLELINPCNGLQKLVDSGLVEFSSNSLIKAHLVLRHSGNVEKRLNNYLLGNTSHARSVKTSLRATFGRAILRLYYLLRTGRLPKILSPSGVGHDPVVENCHLSQHNHAVGYFQSFLWAHNLAEGLIRTLNYVVSLENDEVQLLTELVESIDTIVIQFRLGDFLSVSNKRLGVVNAEYLSAGLKSYSNRCFRQAVIFTDDNSEAQKRLSLEFEGSITYASENLPALTCMLLMSKANWLVISNSTFGWWGAFLGSKNTSEAVAPIPWFKDLDEPVGLIPDDWNRVRVIY